MGASCHLKGLPLDLLRIIRRNAAFAHTPALLQDAAKYPTKKERDAIIAEYCELAVKHPGNSTFVFLAARHSAKMIMARLADNHQCRGREQRNIN